MRTRHTIEPVPDLDGRPCHVVRRGRLTVIVGSADGPAAHVHREQAIRFAEALDDPTPYATERGRTEAAKDRARRRPRRRSA